jgi:hypothetical protein
MILDIVLIGVIIIIIMATMMDYRDLWERLQGIQDDIAGLLNRIPSSFSITILLMTGILVISFLVAILPKT